MSGPRPIDRLLALMARLRDPRAGCPWDREQTFETIAPYTIEEAYEVADAIETGDVEGLRDELGDLLFQVVFHARIAEERGLFAFDDVASAIADKMERRHPHVFGEALPGSAAALRPDWEAAKARERAERAALEGIAASALDGVGNALPALTRAAKLQGRAARVGFDWPELEGVLAKIEEEVREIRDALAAGEAPSRIREEVGDLLFSCVNLSRRVDAEPEGTLRAANRKFEARFRALEAALTGAGIDIGKAGLAELEAEWSRVKAREKR